MLSVEQTRPPTSSNADRHVPLRSRCPQPILDGGWPAMASITPIVLPVEDADLKLEWLAGEALTALGRAMCRGQEESVRLAAATAVLRAWQKSLRGER